MPDVILIFPITHYGSVGWQGQMLPLSVLQVAAPLVKEGIGVTVIDQRVNPRWREALEAELGKEGTVCVGISSMTGPQIRGALDTAAIVRRVSPHVPIVWGGVHPSIEPRQTIAHEYADVVVIGEGEHTFSDLVRRLMEGKSFADVPGVITKDHSDPLTTHMPKPLDLDHVPWPAYELIDVSRYTECTFRSGPGLAMVTSRGCPHSCAYCYNLAFHRRRWRARSAESTVEHMKFLKKTFGITRIFLLDDEFFVDQRRVMAICRALDQEKLELSIDNANITVKDILRYDDDTLGQMKRVGFDKLFIGAESGSDEILEKIGKGISTEMIIQANLKLKKAGIKAVFSWMTGFPYETSRQTRETLALMIRILKENPSATVYGMNIYKPYPGTLLYTDCLRRGMDLPGSLEEWTRPDVLAPVHMKDDPFFTKAQRMSAYLDRKAWAHQRGVKALLKSLYSSVVRFRIKRDFYSFMPEIGLLPYLRGEDQKQEAM